jgi:anti-sigma regulatory factor (Ser/Thr protein kinase)
VFAWKGSPLGVPVAPDESWRLDPTVRAPRQARDWVDQALRLWEVDDPEGIADILTSELITNAVRYAGSRPLMLRLAWELGRLRLEVEDDGSGTIEMRSPDPRRGDGYGLQLVQQLADDWGWEPTRSGRKVWCEIRLADSRPA